LRPLQPQHQLNQLFLAQTFKIAAAHTSRESANPSWRKGLGNYASTFRNLCAKTARYGHTKCQFAPNFALISARSENYL
jgi:hypothetical protein